MEKIKFITDSASDIPEEEARAYGIEVLPIPIAIDGKDYHERVDFTNREFYKLLTDAARIPVTSHIPHTRYAEVYRHAAEDGYRKIINVTINSKGSNMFAAANMGKDLFAEEYPELAEKTQITVIDSLCYTYTYGYAVVQAAKQAEEGKSYEEILTYLDDYFSRVETYFSVYNLDFAKKSGRISVAAACVGDMLGLRPIMSIIDGEIKIIEKVRGDKTVVPKLAQIARQRRRGEHTPFFAIRADRDEVGEELEKMLVKSFGKHAVCLAEAGASITINAGPNLVGCMVMGERRK